LFDLVWINHTYVVMDKLREEVEPVQEDIFWFGLEKINAADRDEIKELLEGVKVDIF
jgi:hypothetical protein